MERISANQKKFGFTCEGKKIRFCLPQLYHNGISDFIQRRIYFDGTFFDYEALRYIKQNYLKEGAVILDIGSNIGNHVIFWLKICNAKTVYCFEPIKDIYDVLCKNIKVNHLENDTKLFNCAVGQSAGFGEIKSFNAKNTGSTEIKESEAGDIKIISIDSLDFEDNVDFIKIDVEGFEYDVLKGCVETLRRHKPIVYIESRYNFSLIDSFLTEMSYTLDYQIDSENFIYLCK